MSWTADDHVTLVEMWTNGRPARDIAIKLGKTKNSVLGYAHRVGLAGAHGSHGRENPVGKSDTASAEATFRQRREAIDRAVLDAIAADADAGRVLRQNAGIAAATGLSVKQVQKSLHRLYRTNEIRLWLSGNKQKRVAYLSDGRRTASPYHQPTGEAPRVQADKAGKGRDRTDPSTAWSRQISENMSAHGTPHKPRRRMPEREMPRPYTDTCQWIEGEPRPDESCKCGQPTFAGAYCRDHAARVWTRAVKAEEMV